MSDHPSTLSNPRGLLLQILALIVAAAAILGFQTLTGVWNSDIGADPDEPAHAVTSLMVRDYLADGLGTSPIAFAQRYYEAFPKVALGHYPPVYYAVTGVLLLPWAQPQVFFVLQAVLCGVLAMQVVSMARRLGMSTLAAACAALLTVGLPVTLKLSQLVMADLLLTCLCLAAVDFWTRYAEKPRLSMALLFGFTSAAAILTKGSGMALALVPVVTLVGLWRWDWLKRISFWMAGLPVAILAGPWMLYSSKITKEGMVHTPLGQYALEGIRFYCSSLSYSLSYPVAVMACVGGVMWVRRRSSLAVHATALLGLLIGTLLIMLLIPTGYSARYWMPLLPVVALMAVWPLDQCRLSVPWKVGAALAFGGMVCWSYPSFAIHAKNVAGYDVAVEQALQSRVKDLAENWLVSGDPRGEGAVVAMAAFEIRDRAHTSLRIHRASKELASTDWLGRDYKANFATPEEVLRYLDNGQITCVLVDQLPAGEAHWAHEDVLLEALQKSPAWRLLYEGSTSRPYQEKPNRMRVFRRQL